MWCQGAPCRVSRGTALFGLSLLAALSGCARITTTGPTTLTDPPIAVTEQDRIHAALAFIAYAGDDLVGTDAQVEKILTPCVRQELETQPLTRGRFDLVWGPAVSKFVLAEYDDNMMFVVRDLVHPDRLVVAIRGTNPPALLDWLAEDFWVDETVAWERRSIPGAGNPIGRESDPRISNGTHVGLEALRYLKPHYDPDYDSAGNPVRVRDFLAGEVKKGTRMVTVVGHSLAGALAPTFALWLHDTRTEWDPQVQVQLEVVALAGATPGNADFSAYYNARLGEATKRLHNPFDIVPLAWNEATLATIPGLYAPRGIELDLAEAAAYDVAVGLAEGKGYTQLVQEAPSLSAGFAPDKRTFFEQIHWQHHCGYYCAMRIETRMEIVSASCAPEPSEKKRLCPVCLTEKP
jgi:hypothetical protein